MGSPMGSASARMQTSHKAGNRNVVTSIRERIEGKDKIMDNRIFICELFGKCRITVCAAKLPHEKRPMCPHRTKCEESGAVVKCLRI